MPAFPILISEESLVGCNMAREAKSEAVLPSINLMLHLPLFHHDDSTSPSGTNQKKI